MTIASTVGGTKHPWTEEVRSTSIERPAVHMSIDLVPDKVQLGSLTVPRIWTGLWQLSSNAWGSAPAARVRQQMLEYAASGYTAFGM